MTTGDKISILYLAVGFVMTVVAVFIYWWKGGTIEGKAGDAILIFMWGLTLWPVLLLVLLSVWVARLEITIPGRNKKP